MIVAFGSEVYGATASIAQFLSYITLLEGGIGGVARAELYEPLAKRDYGMVSNVYHAAKRLFFCVGGVFIVYALIVAFFYHDIADTPFDRTFTFLLVCVISISTVGQYFGGIAYQTLLNADQKRYICNLVVILTTVLNTVTIVVLTYFGCSVITVKLVSSCIFVLRPILFFLYVRKNYSFPRPQKNVSALKQKWTGLGQHLAYFFHTNTDVVLLTLLADLKTVSVYSVYNLIIASMRNLVISFAGGMEAAFGEMIAKKEPDALRSAFRKYQFMLSAVSTVMFGSTALLIIPFVRLYTADVSDADYVQPIFACVLIFAEMINCVMQPCSSLPISANKMKETRWGAYGEVSLNIVLSLLLIRWNPLLGVAIGTLAATAFKGIYYMIYAGRRVLCIRIRELMKSFVFAILSVGACAVLGITLMEKIAVTSFSVWVLWAIGVFLIVLAVTLMIGKFLYPEELKSVFNAVKIKYKR